MKSILASLALLSCLVPPAFSAGHLDPLLAPTDQAPLLDKSGYAGDNLGDTREGGESWADATVILYLEFTDSGATCDNTDDITLPCASSAAPDVVYSYTPLQDESINVSLCGSGYDTALGIYDANRNNIACNDDYCDLQSGIFGVNLAAGQTYYIVIDGYSTSCGSYEIDVTQNVPCIECPAGGQLEGEPPCHDGYWDVYNGGCSTSSFMVLCPQQGNSMVLCGKGGTYVSNGLSYRDTDWFVAYGTGGTMTATWVAEFPILGIFIYETDCSNLEFEAVTGMPCEDVTISRHVDDGVAVWLWAGATQFNGIPCESEYLIRIEGLRPGPECEPSPVEDSRWGRVKSRFR